LQRAEAKASGKAEKAGNTGENGAWASVVKKMHQTENRWQNVSYFLLLLMLLGLFVYFLLFHVGEAL